MPSSMLQNAFASGEISPLVYGRYDIEKFGAAAKSLRNMLVRPHGAVTFRPGFRHLATCREPARASRLIPFTFNRDQTVEIELGHEFARFISNGGYALEASDAITGISQASPARITTAATLSVGDDVFVSGVVGMVEINGRILRVTATGAGYVDVDADTTGYTAYASGGDVARVYTIATPYQESELLAITYAQTNDLVTLCHPSHAPRQLIRFAPTNWSLGVISFGTSATAPAAPTAAGENTDGTTASFAGLPTTYVITAVDASSGQESLPSPASAQVLKPAVWREGEVIRVTWTAVGTADIYRVFRDRNGIYGFVGEAEGTEFVDENYLPDITETPPETRNPFSGPDNYPAATGFFQQRRVFAGTNNDPQGVWMTRTGEFANLNASSPLRPDDAMSFTIVSYQQNAIRHVFALDRLFYMTTAGEWQMSADDSATTTANPSVTKASSRGTAAVPPISVSDAALFVQSDGKVVRSLAYDIQSDGFSNENMTILAEHLFENDEIVDWAYQQEPDSIVWTVMKSGRMRALTFEPEHGVFAWSPVETDGRVVSVSVTQEGGFDRVHVCVARKDGAGTETHRIERLCLPEITETREGHVHLDASVTKHNTAAGLSLRNLDNRLRSAAAAFKVVDGLEHLEGRAVTALADGSVFAGLTVQGGQVTLPIEVDIAHVGLPYSGEVETLPMQALLAGPGAAARKTRVNAISVSVYRSAGLFFGRTRDELDEWKGVAQEKWDEVEPLYSGQISVPISGGWEYETGAIIQQTAPLPLTLRTMAPETTIAG